MAEIKPFRAIRPKSGKEALVSSLPYDVYNECEARELVKQNPESFLAIDRPETLFEEKVDIYSQKCYEKAKEVFWEKVEQGEFIQDSKPMFYVYQLEMNQRKQTGIVACASVDDYLNQTIKKHENTRADKEIDRIKHVGTIGAQTGPIFLAYRKQEKLNEIIERVTKEQPFFSFESEDQIRHLGYFIEQEEDIITIQAVFRNLKDIYIADGHHRCASAVKVCEEKRRLGTVLPEDEVNFFLSVLFPAEDLMILDYNRLVKDLNGYDKDELLTEISKVCHITQIPNNSYSFENKESIRPKRKGIFALYLEEHWYELEIKERHKQHDIVERLDVSLLQKLILEPIFGIGDPKIDKRIDFVGGIRGIVELERRVNEEGGCAFLMHPTSMEELMNVSDAAKLMPPKSTWFEPKLRSGLFIHEIIGGFYGEKTIQTNELARD